MAAYPAEQIKRGEVIVQTNPDVGFPQLFTYDELHDELAHAYGYLPQVADTTVAAARWQHGSALFFVADRVRYVIKEDVLDTPQFPDDFNPVNIGDGWEIRQPFPYDITVNSVEEFYNVATEGVNTFGQTKQPGYTFSYVPVREVDPNTGEETGQDDRDLSYFEAGVGFGSPGLGLPPSASLDDLVKVRYNEPLVDYSMLEWNQVEQTWETVYNEPTLANRSDVNLNLDTLSNGDAITYKDDAFFDGPGWTNVPLTTEGVLEIPDGRRTVNKDNEYFVVPGLKDKMGTRTVYKATSRDFYYAKEYVSEPAQAGNPFGSRWVLTNGTTVVDINDAEGWDRFPEGAFYATPTVQASDEQFIELYSTGFTEDPTGDSELRDTLNVWDFPSNIYLNPNPNIDPEPGRSDFGRGDWPSWRGSWTYQFWFKASEAFVGEHRSDAFGSGEYDLVTFLKDAAWVNNVALVSRFRSERDDDGSYKVVAAGRDIIPYVNIGEDYHIAVQYDSVQHRTKVWVNGVVKQIVNEYGIDSDDQGATNAPELPLRGIRMLWNLSGAYMADFALSLQTEYNTDDSPIQFWTKEFTPPSEYGRRIVAGPKAALRTLGVTKTGFFSWVGQATPTKWNTAFAPGQFDTFSQPNLAIDHGSLKGNQVIAWDETKQKFTTKPAGVGAKTAYVTPGTIDPTRKLNFGWVVDPSKSQAFDQWNNGALQFFFNRTQNGRPAFESEQEGGYKWSLVLYNTVHRSRPFVNAGFPVLQEYPDGSKGFSRFPIREYFGNDRWEWPNAWQASGWRSLTDNIEGQDLDFYGFGIKFKTYDLGRSAGTIILNDFIQIEVTNRGALSFRLKDRLAFGYGMYEYDPDYIPGVTPPGDTIMPFLWEQGHSGTIAWVTGDRLIKSDTEHELVVIADYADGKLAWYLDGERQNFEGQVKTWNGDTDSDTSTFYIEPGDRPNFDPFGNQNGIARGWGYYTNKGLPEYVSIKTRVDKRGPKIDSGSQGGNKILPGLNAVLKGIAFGSIKPTGYRSQRFFDFKDLFDVDYQAPGMTFFTGRDSSPDVFDAINNVSDLGLTDGSPYPRAGHVEVSSQTNKDGTPLAKMDGEPLGASRTVMKLAQKQGGFNFPLGEWKQEEDGFLVYEDRFGDKSYVIEEVSDLGVNGESNWRNYYTLQSLQDPRILTFEDVLTPVEAVSGGDTFIWDRGSWRVGPVDTTSPIIINEREPVSNPQAGDLLYWSTARAGWVNEQPRQYVQYGIGQLSDVEIDSTLESNEMLIYDALDGKFKSRRSDYFAYLEGLNNVSYRSEPDTGDVLVFDGVTRTYYNDYINRPQYLDTLNDVEYIGSAGQPRVGEWLFYSASRQQWVNQEAAEDIRFGDFQWESKGFYDFDLKRRYQRTLMLGARPQSNPGRPDFPDYPNGLPHDRDLDYAASPQNIGNPQENSNSARGDGGEFEYGEVDCGYAMGIFGGGDFETGLEDKPVEMIVGLDSGDFVTSFDKSYEILSYMSDYFYDDVFIYTFNADGDPFADRTTNYHGITGAIGTGIEGPFFAGQPELVTEPSGLGYLKFKPYTPGDYSIPGLPQWQPINVANYQFPTLNHLRIDNGETNRFDLSTIDTTDPDAHLDPPAEDYYSMDNEARDWSMEWQLHIPAGSFGTSIEQIHTERLMMFRPDDEPGSRSYMEWMVAFLGNGNCELMFLYYGQFQDTYARVTDVMTQIDYTRQIQDESPRRLYRLQLPQSVLQRPEGQSFNLVCSYDNESTALQWYVDGVFYGNVFLNDLFFDNDGEPLNPGELPDKREFRHPWRGFALRQQLGAAPGTLNTYPYTTRTVGLIGGLGEENSSVNGYFTYFGSAFCGSVYHVQFRQGQYAINPWAMVDPANDIGNQIFTPSSTAPEGRPIPQTWDAETQTAIQPMSVINMQMDDSRMIGQPQLDYFLGYDINGLFPERAVIPDYPDARTMDSPFLYGDDGTLSLDNCPPPTQTDSTVTAFFDNGFNAFAERGQQGYFWPLRDELNLLYEDFTIETLIGPYPENRYSYGSVDDVTPDLLNEALYLCGVASDEDLSDPSLGRSWSVRLFMFEPDQRVDEGLAPYEQGVKFEFWTINDDGEIEYNYIDFLLGDDSMYGDYNAYQRKRSPNAAWPPGSNAVDEYGEYADKEDKHLALGHLIIQRSIKRKSITIFMNGRKMEKTHPNLDRPFRDVSSFPNPTFGIGADANRNFNLQQDYVGYMKGFRLTRSKCLYRNDARFPDDVFRAQRQVYAVPGSYPSAN